MGAKSSTSLTRKDIVSDEQKMEEFEYEKKRLLQKELTLEQIEIINKFVAPSIQDTPHGVFVNGLLFCGDRTAFNKSSKAYGLTKFFSRSDLPMFRNFGETGMNMNMMASRIGMHEANLKKVFNEFPELAAEYEKGKSYIGEKVMGALVENATKNGNFQAQKFILSSHFGMNEKKEIEISGNPDKPLVIEGLDTKARHLITKLRGVEIPDDVIIDADYEEVDNDGDE